MGEYGKRAEPAAAGRRAAPAGNALGNAPLAIRTLSPAQSVTPAQYSPGWRHQPPRTLSHQLAAMHPKTPNTSQTFPILPTKAAINRIARLPRRSVTKPGVCGVQRHPPTPEAAEDKPAATHTIAGKQYCEQLASFGKTIPEGVYLRTRLKGRRSQGSPDAARLLAPHKKSDG